MSEKTHITGKVTKVAKDLKRDGGHRYDIVGEDKEGKKKLGYRWNVSLDTGETGIVRKMDPDKPPCKEGDVMNADIKKDEHGTFFIGAKFTDENGAPQAGAFKSTYNDPVITVPKMRGKALSLAVRVSLKLFDWENNILEKTGETNKYHCNLIKENALYAMQQVFFTFITDDMRDTVRDNMELRLDCLQMAVSCMELPSFTHLKGNDEDAPDPSSGKMIIKKKLSVKLVEQAEAYYTKIK